MLALARHWAGLPETPRMRAAAARALAARRYREATAEQRDIRERIAVERVALERAEAAASHQAALARASSYEEVVRLMQEPPAPRREFNVVGLCEGSGGSEPAVVAVTRGFVLSEADAVEGCGRTVCTAMVSASGPQEAAEIFRRDHRERCGKHPTE